MSITSIKEIMSKNLDVLYDDMTFDEALEKAKDRDHNIFPVVDQDRKLKGLVFKKDLHQGNFDKPESNLDEIIHPATCTVYENESVNSVIKKIEDKRDPRIFVLSSQHSKLVGIVSPINFVKLKSKER